MKILVVGTNKKGGGYTRMNYYEKYLTYINHEVELMHIPLDNFESQIWYFSTSAYNRIAKNASNLFKSIGDYIEKIVNKNNYDVVIGMETKFSYVLTKNLDCLKIFSCQSLEADERLFSKKHKLEDVKSIREVELEIMEKSDFVLFPWKTTEHYVKKYIYDGKNLMTLKSCCNPREKVASYFYPISIVSLGSLGFEWANLELLSHLSNISPYLIDVYGAYKPDARHNLRYYGYAKDLDLIYNYQFGINTLSKDPFRRNHFSSRILNYLNFGLPVLFPEWQKFPHELKGCIPYNEENFLEVVEKYSDKEEWLKIAKSAIEQSHELDWKTTLSPLGKIIEG